LKIEVVVVEVFVLYAFPERNKIFVS